MSQTVIALYDHFETARRVVEDLVDAGYDRDNISIIANDASGEYARYIDRDVHDDDDVSAGEGAGFGAVVGTLVGLGVALIPGIGPVIAAGPFAASNHLPWSGWNGAARCRSKSTASRSNRMDSQSPSRKPWIMLLAEQRTPTRSRRSLIPTTPVTVGGKSTSRRPA